MMPEISKIPKENLGEALEAAVREAVDDETFRKVKRCSYAQSAHDHVSKVFGNSGLGGTGSNMQGNRRSTMKGPDGNNLNVNDPAVVEQLLSTLLGQQNASQVGQAASAFNRMRPMSRSMRGGSFRVNNEMRRPSRNSFMAPTQGGSTQLPTIHEGNNSGNRRTLSTYGRALNTPVVRNILQTLRNSQQRHATGDGTDDNRLRPPSRRLSRRGSDSETTSLTQNQPE